MARPVNMERIHKISECQQLSVTTVKETLKQILDLLPFLCVQLALSKHIRYVTFWWHHDDDNDDDDDDDDDDSALY